MVRSWSEVTRRLRKAGTSTQECTHLAFGDWRLEAIYAVDAHDRHAEPVAEDQRIIGVDVEALITALAEHLVQQDPYFVTQVATDALIEHDARGKPVAHRSSGSVG